MPLLTGIIGGLAERVGEPQPVSVSIAGDPSAVEAADEPPESAAPLLGPQTGSPDEPGCAATSTCQPFSPCAPPDGCGASSPRPSTAPDDSEQTLWLTEVLTTGLPLAPPTTDHIELYTSILLPGGIRAQDDLNVYFDCSQWHQAAGCVANIPIGAADGTIGSGVALFGCVAQTGCEDFNERKDAVLDLASCLAPSDLTATEPSRCNAAIDAIIEACSGPGFITCAGDIAAGGILTRPGRIPSNNRPDARVAIDSPRPLFAPDGLVNETAGGLTNLGRGSARGPAFFDDFSAGQGFSGVYDKATGSILAFPSGPGGGVPRRGGHAVVNQRLTEAVGAPGGQRAGFTAILQTDGSLQVQWLSRSVNPSGYVSDSLRPAIIDALSQTSGRTVVG